MIINLNPVRSDEPALILQVEGDIITINGESFDFTPLPAGYQLNAEDIESEWFGVHPVVRSENGELSMTLRFPHPSGAGEDMRFPVPIHVTQDGPVALPTYTAPEPLPSTPPPQPEPVHEDLELLESTASSTNPDHPDYPVEEGVGPSGIEAPSEDPPAGD